MQTLVVGIPYDPIWHEVLLQKKSRPHWQAGFLNGPGGKVIEGETVHQAVARECLEELSLHTLPETWHHRLVVEWPTVEVHYLVYILPKHYEKPPFVEDEPCRRVHVHMLPPSVLPDLRWVLPLCLDLTIGGPIRLKGTAFQFASQQTHDNPYGHMWEKLRAR